MKRRHLIILGWVAWALICEIAKPFALFAMGIVAALLLTFVIIALVQAKKPHDTPDSLHIPRAGFTFSERDTMICLAGALVLGVLGILHFFTPFIASFVSLGAMLPALFLAKFTKWLHYRFDLKHENDVTWYFDYRRKGCEERALKRSVSNMTGVEFEHYTARCLKKKGYRHVRVTPVSGDYGADIVATAPTGERVCFQCKRYSKPVGIKAVQEISSAKNYYKCEKAAVITTSSYTQAAANLARVENVALFDIAYFE